MRKSTLPPELISLIHHIELNQVGWWDKTVQQLIISCMWLSSKNMTLQDIINALSESFSVKLDAIKVKKQIESLCSTGTLMPLNSEQFKISENSLNEFYKKAKETEQTESKVKQRFLDVIGQNCPSIDSEEIWQDFSEGLLTPLIREMGARTYELLSGTTIDLDTTEKFQIFLRRYPPEVCQVIRAAIVGFIDPKNPDTRSYILRQLNAYFFLEAGNLGEDTLQALAKTMGSTPSFNVFVDTNFLFSMLGLHENPSNEAAQSLINLVKLLSTKVKVKLYVSPVTVDETRRVLEFYTQCLGSLRLGPNLADIASTSGLSGFTQKFAEECKKAGRPLKAEDYFKPYTTDLIRILKTKGIELFNQKIDNYLTDQRVVCSLKEQMEFEQRRFKERAKSYKELEHDIVLWHFVLDHRPERIESPLEAGSWIVTVDFRFLGFDSYKRNNSPHKIPVCVHPATLIQMLQFWVPRTIEFEEAILGNLRLPFLFQEFDPDAEKVTIRILQTLARFENVDDLPQEALSSIILNNALRQNLSAETDVDKQIELVREALIEENQKVRRELENTHSRLHDLEVETSKKEETIAKIEDQTRRHKRAIEESERTLAEERKDRKSLEERLNRIETNLKDKERKDEEKKRIGQFVVKWAIIPIVIILALGLMASSFTMSLTKWGFWQSTLVVWSLLLILWIKLTDKQGTHDPILRDWRIFVFFHKFKKWFFYFLGAVLLSVIGNAVWDYIKTLSK